MRTLTGAEIVGVWEAGQGLHPLDRAITVLGAALPWQHGELVALPLGRRDAVLLQLRRRLFGEVLACYAECPACAAPVELSIAAAELGGDLPPVAEPVLTHGEYRATVRAADSADLAAVIDAGDMAGGRRVLLERCIQVERGAQEVALDDVPGPVLAAAIERMAELDPGAERRLRLSCAPRRRPAR